ncbi:MAG: hypothetical protein ABJH68_14560 [Ilumatobacter sp.]|uniref:hypothetical protein n=1 Tax=Ilumatobacter sp. TaxID=1967498 RepID=UPI0032990CC1
MSQLESGSILINPRGRVRIVRSRTSADDGWNCTDGAPILDVEADDRTLWTPYTPDQLATALEVAMQVGALSSEPLMAGGIRTWDACSGRPCVLPKLAGVVRECSASLSNA